MIRFFRGLRHRLILQGKVGKYISYAVGEISLVMIGILLALQVNNWNENRKAVIAEKELLSKLVVNLQRDSIFYEETISKIYEVGEVYEQLYRIGIKNESADILEKPHYIRFILRYNPVSHKNDPFLANKISNDSIREEILTYFRMQADVDEVYLELADIIRNKMRVYLGEQNLYDLANRFEPNQPENEFIKRDGLIKVATFPEFQQILFEADFKLFGIKEEIDIIMIGNKKIKQMILNYLNE